jgi:hypothetical protein
MEEPEGAFYVKFEEIRIDGRVIADRGSFVMTAPARHASIRAGGIEMVLEFVDGGGEPSVRSRQEGPKRLVYTLDNFSNPLGISVTMEQVITSDGSIYDLGVVVHTLGEGKVTRLISYTFLQRP